MQQQQQQKIPPPGTFQLESYIQLEAPVVLAGNGNMYNNRPRAPPIKEEKKRKIEEPEENLYKKRCEISWKFLIYRFLQMAAIDKQQILKPDYISAFQSYEDIFHRLQPFYRVLDFKEEDVQGNIHVSHPMTPRFDPRCEQYFRTYRESERTV